MRDYLECAKKFRLLYSEGFVHDDNDDNNNNNNVIREEA